MVRTQNTTHDDDPAREQSGEPTHNSRPYVLLPIRDFANKLLKDSNWQ